VTTLHHDIWKKWAKKLQQIGLQEVAASVLEAAAPVNLVGAQLVYLGQPVLRGFVPNENLNALADLLEQPEHTRAFIEDLRELEA
jgi:hypothetical protein